MSTHDRIGVEIFRDAFSSKDLSDIVGTSHAWFNGNPHEPHLPTGDNIPVVHRILTIADAYDAMTSDRVYRKACAPQEAFNELRRCAGDQFDPNLVERFIDSVRKIRFTILIARFPNKWPWLWEFKPSPSRSPWNAGF